MEQDTYSPADSPWPEAESLSPTPVAVPASVSPPPRPATEDRWIAPVSSDSDGGRLHRLLWIFAILTVVLVAPSVIGRIEYARTAARERARYDVAKENLRALNLEQINAALQMPPTLVKPSVVNIRTVQGEAEGQGSGVIVDKEGYIVTNNHVVEGVRTVEIQLSDGSRGPATVVGVDAMTDIAVLKTEMEGLIPAEWGSSADLEVGNLVWAVGSPFGLQESVTYGILSAKERRGISGGVIQEFLQSDAAVNPGNSGGPLVDIHGRIVGINTAIIGSSYQGISFAIPVEMARESYDQLRKDGYIRRGFLGIDPQHVPDALADDLEIGHDRGVWVRRVDPGTPAAAAGIRPNDVILAWNGKEFDDPTLLSRAIAATVIGSEAPVSLVRVRDGEPRKMELKVRVAARPVD